MKKIWPLITKKILVIFNVIVILILAVEINYPGSVTEYLFVWLLFLAPLVIFDIILFCIPKLYKKVLGTMKKDSEKISLSRKIIYAVLVLFSLGFIFAATLVITSFAGRLANGSEKQETPTINNKF